jgi:hypothetical protein
MDSWCADCGGFDLEWMRICPKHHVEYCRSCQCPYCAEEDEDDDDFECDELEDYP